MKHARLAVALVIVALVLLTGCSAPTSASNSNVPASLAGAASKICQPLETVNQALTQLSNIGENTTIGEIKAAQQKLAGALNALATVPGIQGSAYDSIKSMSDQLAAAVKNQPDSATVGQVGPLLGAFKSSMAQAHAAVAKLASTLNCES